MRIFCRVCNQGFLSASGNAEREVLLQMSEHMASHPKEAGTLAKSMHTTLQLLSTYLLIKHYVTIPEEETKLRETFKVNEETLRSIFGMPTITLATKRP